MRQVPGEELVSAQRHPSNAGQPPALDIVGAAWAEGPTSIGPRGGTGYGVASIVEYISSRDGLN